MVLREVKRDVEGDPSLGLTWYIYIYMEHGLYNYNWSMASNWRLGGVWCFYLSECDPPI